MNGWQVAGAWAVIIGGLFVLWSLLALAAYGVYLLAT